jgi:hypothetical protein
MARAAAALLEVATARAGGANRGGIGLSDPTCTFTAECEGLDEAACQSLDRGDDGGCLPRFGEVWPADTGETTYAGCATRVC